MVKLIVALISLAITYFGYIIITPQTILTKIFLVVGLIIASLLIQVLLFFISALVMSLFVSSEKDYNHYNKFYRKVFYLYTKIVLSLFGVKIKTEGLEKLPKDEPFVLYFNHKSNLDTFVIDVALKKYPIVFIGKKSLFKIPFFGKIITKLGYISLDRSNIRSELISIQKGINYINEKECSVGVAPEGTRNFQNKVLLDFKPGCFHLVTKTKAPLVIVVLKGAEEVKKNLLVKRHVVNMKVVDVIYNNEYANLKTNEISDIVKEKMYNELTNNNNQLDAD